MGLGGGGVNRQQHHDNDVGGVIGRLGRAKNVRTAKNVRNFFSDE